LRPKTKDHHHHHDTERQEIQAEEGEETPMIKEQGLEGSQMRIEKEDGTRDPHPGQKKMTTMSRTMNSLTCSLESWPTPWDNQQGCQRNPLPCLGMRNTKISACG